MVEKLFGSKTRFKLLELFMSNPNRAFYVRELTRATGEQINSIRRELSNLSSLGIITSDSSSKHLYYEVNQKHEKYPALVGLMSNTEAQVTADGSGKADKQTPQNPSQIGVDERALGDASLVVLSGTFTRDAQAPVDVLLVGNITADNRDAYINKLESLIDREIRYACFESADFEYRYKINDRFISQVLNSKLSVRVDRDNITKQLPDAQIVNPVETGLKKSKPATPKKPGRGRPRGSSKTKKTTS